MQVAGDPTPSAGSLRKARVALKNLVEQPGRAPEKTERRCLHQLAFATGEPGECPHPLAIKLELAASQLEGVEPGSRCHFIRLGQPDEKGSHSTSLSRNPKCETFINRMSRILIVEDEQDLAG